MVDTIFRAPDDRRWLLPNRTTCGFTPQCREDARPWLVNVPGRIADTPLFPNTVPKDGNLRVIRYSLWIIPIPSRLAPIFSFPVARLRQREVLLVDPFPLIKVGVQVDLGGLDRGMPEVLLDHPEVL